MANSEMEPNAELRQMAAQLRQMYVALTDQGFNDQQALVIIGQVLSAGQKGRGQ